MHSGDLRGGRTSRRGFLKVAGLAGAGTLFGPRLVFGRQESPNEKLDLGIVGVANRGSANLGGVGGENIVALCDIDANYLAAAGERYPKAKHYSDFRRMIESEKLDGVVVSTADHTHALATAAALRAGMHVYCEKPLTHSVHEARVVAELAKEHGRITQMGTQIHAGENYRRVVELIRTRAIGAVREVHVICGKSWGGTDETWPRGEEVVPEHLRYDLWLGPRQGAPFHNAFLPGNWRRFWAFGGGTLGDMACHYMDLPFWALELRHPVHVRADGPPAHAHVAPTQMEAHWDFPARGDRPAVKMSWYDGGRRPAIFPELGLDGWNDGVLFVGDEGQLISNYGSHTLLPAEKFAEFTRPEPFLAPSIGHHAEWIAACKGKGETTCSFDYSGALTETVLLGAVAYRLGEGFDWNAGKLEAVGKPEVQRLIRHEYPAGWEL